MRNEITANYRHTESLTLFLLKDKAFHTQTRTNKKPRKKKYRKNLPSVPSRQACSFGPNRGKMAHAASRSTSSMSLSDSFRALVTAAAGCLSPHDHTTNHRTTEQPSPSSSRTHTVVQQQQRRRRSHHDEKKHSWCTSTLPALVLKFPPISTRTSTSSTSTSTSTTTTQPTTTQPTTTQVPLMRAPFIG